MTINMSIIVATLVVQLPDVPAVFGQRMRLSAEFSAVGHSKAVFSGGSLCGLGPLGGILCGLF